MKKRYLALILVCIVFLLCFRVIAISGSSMYPTHAEGDILLCIRSFHPPAAGEEILFQKDGVWVLKRVYAVSGYPVVIDGMSICYWDATDSAVPPGYVFVLGDNLETSYDSRNEAFGLVPIESIWGNPLLTIWHIN
ncbi:MAG TPA: hypothetical protein IAC31_04155 [Candidatus Faecousia intestinigallinarum]|nr:hypothetical protein [Candidatus Faecousia intestinigallinarum]